MIQLTVMLGIVVMSCVVGRSVWTTFRVTQVASRASQHEHIDRAEDREADAKSARFMREFAAKNLQVGLEAQEVEQVLSQEESELMFTEGSTLHGTYFYGTGSLGDPILAVTLEPQRDGNWYVSGWEVQE